MLTIKFESKELAELRKENLELKEKMWRYGSIEAQLREAHGRIDDLESDINNQFDCFEEVYRKCGRTL